MKDLGVSAFRGKNAEVGVLSVFLEAVKSGRVSKGSVLIVESLDRLNRDAVDEAYDLFRGLIRSGIAIQTMEPERLYDRASCHDNMLNLLEPLFIMPRAAEESRIKSVRLREVWGQKKKKASSEGKPLGKLHPAWIEWTPEGYRLIPERAAIVRAIFRMAIDGLGVRRIVNTLASDPKKYPPFGRSGRWNDGYIDLILSSRAAIGEYQRFTRNPGTGKREHEGPPIRGYFPAVISEQEFDLARAAVLSRKSKSGRPPKEEINLFTGIVFDAIGKTSMHQQTVYRPGGRKTVYLFSNATRQGERNNQHNSGAFQYPLFESAVLSAISELKPADLQEREQPADKREEEIRQLTEDLIAYDHKMRTLGSRAADPRTPSAALPVILATIDQAAKGKQDAAKRLETLKAEAVSGRPETLGEAQSLFRLLATAKGKEAEKLRRRLKSRLRLLIEEIRVVIQHLSYHRRAAHIKIYLHGGSARYVRVFSPKPPIGPVSNLLDLQDADFRDLGGL